MLFESILGNVFDDAAGDGESRADVDWVDFRWDECDRRAHRKRSRGGVDLRLLLPLGCRIRHGDVFARQDLPIAAYVQTTELLVVQTVSPELLATLAYELGNLHAPVEIIGQTIVTPPDGPAEAAVAALGLASTRELRRFTPRSTTLPAPTLGGQFQITRT